VERTFIAIKPDGVQRKLVGEVISRFEAKGFTLVGLKQIMVSKELAEKHYESLNDKPFFKGLIDFITSGPVVAMVWEGEGVVASARLLIGATNPLTADPGTIRGDLAVNVGRNVIHGSDAIETAQREIGLWFSESELCGWTPTIMSWVHE
jgi:nucleoside-diphosphate kinase